MNRLACNCAIAIAKSIAAAKNWKATHDLQQDAGRADLETLWTLDALQTFDGEILDEVLKSSDHRIRAAAVRVLSRQSADEIVSRIEPLINDAHPQVRLETIHAARMADSAKAAELAMLVLDQPMDQYLDFALVQTMISLRPKWLPQVVAGGLDFQGDVSKLLFALRAIGDSASVDPLFRILESNDLEGDQPSKVIQQIAELGGPKQLGRLLQLGFENPQMQNSVLEALRQSSRRRRGRPEGFDLAKLGELPFSPLLGELIGRWKVQPLKSLLTDQLTQADSPEPFQLAAIRGLAEFGDTNAVRDALLNSKLDSVRLAGIVAMADIDQQQAARLAAEFLSANTVAAEAESVANQIVDAFVRRKQGAQQLAEAIEQVQLKSSIARIGLRRASSAGEPGKSLAAAFEKAGRLSKMKLEFTAEEIKDLVETIAQIGNPAAGEQIYRRADLSCIKCHAIGGAGGLVGPDMVSLGASSPVDYIIESMLNPNAKIKEGYHTTTLVTVDGLQFSGKLISETDRQVVLRDVDNREIIVDTADVEGRKINNTSLMPADLMKEIGRDEFVDLVAFLSALGKDGPYKVPATRFNRRWLMQDGSAIFSRVDGSLPVAEMTGNVATMEIEVTSPGLVGLEIDDPNGLRITRNEMKDNLRAKQIVVDLPVGIHRFHVQINNVKNRDSLRVKLIDVEGSPGRAKLINQ